MTGIIAIFNVIVLYMVLLLRANRSQSMTDYHNGYLFLSLFKCLGMCNRRRFWRFCLSPFGLPGPEDF